MTDRPDDPANAGGEEGRRRDGRFRPGRSGNPRGRPAGSRPAALLRLDALAAGAAEELVNRLILDAKAGDREAAIAVLARVWPPRRGRPIRLLLPPLDGAAGTLAAMDAITQAVASGHATPEEGEAVARLIALRASAVDALDLDRRLTTLEERLGDDGGAAP